MGWELLTWPREAWRRPKGSAKLARPATCACNRAVPAACSSRRRSATHHPAPQAPRAARCEVCGRSPQAARRPAPPPCQTDRRSCGTKTGPKAAARGGTCRPASSCRPGRATKLAPAATGVCPPHRRTPRRGARGAAVGSAAGPRGCLP
eukprot:scaffold69233_cov57-Phaeocystis_antarctica.AAC.2